MTKKRRFLLLALVAGLAAGGAGHFYSHREPSYQGKRLSEWAEEAYHDPNQFAYPYKQYDAAVRASGKKAIPTLLRMLQAQDSQGRLKLIELARKQPLVDVHFTPADVYHFAAAEGFRVLGTEAKEAFPELLRLFHDTNRDTLAAEAMAAVSPAAIPFFRSNLSNPDQRVRCIAISRLCMAGSNASVAVPDIIQSLRDSSPDVRNWAAEALGNIRRDADTVLPALFAMAQEDSDGRVRLSSIRAIGSFGSAASGYAPALRQMLSSTNYEGIWRRRMLTDTLNKIDPSALNPPEAK